MGGDTRIEFDDVCAQFERNRRAISIAPPDDY
jgi:hypothetical protein